MEIIKVEVEMWNQNEILISNMNSWLFEKQTTPESIK